MTIGVIGERGREWDFRRCGDEGGSVVCRRDGERPLKGLNV
jgi:hypothetical protein